MIHMSPSKDVYYKLTTKETPLRLSYRKNSHKKSFYSFRNKSLQLLPRLFTQETETAVTDKEDRSMLLAGGTFISDRLS